MLAKPQNFSNLTARRLKPLMEKHAIETEELIVVYDELDLPWGVLRIKPKGSAAGHNGMKSVIASLGTNEIVRVRMGIHPGPPHRERQGFCAGADTARARRGIGGIHRLRVDAVRSIIAEGVAKAMTRFNRRAPGLNTEDA